MNIKSRIEKLEAAAGATSANVDGVAARAEILRLLTEEPDKVESLRMVAVARDCDLSLRCLIRRPAVIDSHAQK